MKLHDRLEQIAVSKEGEAASIRKTLEILLAFETAGARKLIGGKLRKAMELRANGNGHVKRIHKSAQHVAAAKALKPLTTAQRKAIGKRMKAMWAAKAKGTWKPKEATP
jgi:hypothetical protein